VSLNPLGKTNTTWNGGTQDWFGRAPYRPKEVHALLDHYMCPLNPRIKIELTPSISPSDWGSGQIRIEYLTTGRSLALPSPYPSN